MVGPLIDIWCKTRGVAGAVAFKPSQRLSGEVQSQTHQKRRCAAAPVATDRRNWNHRPILASF